MDESRKTAEELFEQIHTFRKTSLDLVLALKDIDIERVQGSYGLYRRLLQKITEMSFVLDKQIGTFLTIDVPKTGTRYRE